VTHELRFSRSIQFLKCYLLAPKGLYKPAEGPRQGGDHSLVLESQLVLPFKDQRLIAFDAKRPGIPPGRHKPWICLLYSGYLIAS
jgi:hypothetical protein